MAEMPTKFFPDGIFDVQGNKHRFIDRWYSRHLRAMYEPSLFEERETDAESYRFLWLPTFHRPLAFRLQIEAGKTGRLTVKGTDGFGGYGPGKLIINKIILLPAKEVNEFQTRLDNLHFWQLQPKDSSRGLDGQEWVFEGVKQGQYHLVVRWSPGKGPFRKTAYFLAELSGLEVIEAY